MPRKKQWITSIFVVFLLFCLLIAPVMAADDKNSYEGNQNNSKAGIDIGELALPSHIQKEIAEKIATKEIVDREINEREKMLSENQLKIDDMLSNKVQAMGFIAESGMLTTASIIKANTGDEIPEGGFIKFSSDEKTRVFSSDGKQISYSIDAEAENVRTPFGQMVPATHIITVPSGASIRTVGNREYVILKGEIIFTIIDETTNTYNNGGNQFFGHNRFTSLAPGYVFVPSGLSLSWVAWAENKTISELNSFNADWILPYSPEAPINYEVPNNIIYNGIEPSDGSLILQPVTAFNFNGLGLTRLN